jgi:hypothetical protein
MADIGGMISYLAIFCFLDPDSSTPQNKKQKTKQNARSGPAAESKIQTSKQNWTVPGRNTCMPPGLTPLSTRGSNSNLTPGEYIFHAVQTVVS